MKRFISIVLIISCAALLFSCDKKDDTVEKDLVIDTIDEVNAMYTAIAPTMVNTVSTISFGEHVLTSTATLKTGLVDGEKASVYDYTRQEIRAITDGSGTDYVDPIVTITGGWQYHEYDGYREIDETTGKFGDWDDTVDDPTPAPGANVININKDTVSDFQVDVENRVITFTVSVKNSEKVFGMEATSEVEVTMTHSGADITSVSLSFMGKVPDKTNYPEAAITVTATYSYEIQEINFG